jgi:hypothetical protein
MRTPAEAGVIGLEPQRGDTIKLAKSFRVVEHQVLADVTQEAMSAARADVDGMSRRDPIRVDNLVGVGIIAWVKLEQTDASHAFQAIDAIAVKSDVKGVWIFVFHKFGLLV